MPIFLAEPKTPDEGYYAYWTCDWGKQCKNPKSEHSWVGRWPALKEARTDYEQHIEDEHDGQMWPPSKVQMKGTTRGRKG